MQNDQSQDENQLIALRREKLQQRRTQGTAYPNQFKRQHLAEQLLSQYDHLDKAELEAQSVQVKVAGRMMAKRIMGKASFTHIQDMSGRIQLYIQRDALP